MYVVVAVSTKPLSSVNTDTATDADDGDDDYNVDVDDDETDDDDDFHCSDSDDSEVKPSKKKVNVKTGRAQAQKTEPKKPAAPTKRKDCNVLLISVGDDLVTFPRRYCNLSCLFVGLTSSHWHNVD